jgi:hypothetical protein
MKRAWKAVLAGLFVAAMALPAQAYANTVTYKGQGLLADGFGGYDLIQEKCDGNINGILENGADAEGPYLLFVLTATGAKNADISFFGATPVAMTKFGNGTFKYISPWVDPDTLIAGPVVATYDAKVKNAQLVISHGCRPFDGKGAWCSPGFWRNVDDAGWALIGKNKTDLFNSTVVPSFYDTAYATFQLGNGPGATLITDPTLDQVLKNPGGVNSTISGPFGLDQFNATGAFLTDNIPGYDYSDAARLLDNESDTCPIDNSGDFKVVTP